MELHKVSLENKALLDSYLSGKVSENSEFTFTNLFIWRKSYDMQFAIIDGMLCIMPRHIGGPRSVTFPIGNGDIKPVIEKLLKYFEETNQEPLIRLYDDYAEEKLHDAFPDMFTITEDEPYYDYVYRVEDLINLSGKKYHAKRNFINRFENSYNYEYSPLTAADKEEVMQMFDLWYDTKEGEVEAVDEAKEAVTEFLKNLEHLDVKGGCLRVDGKMVAFSFGEKLCDNMVVIHLEHADTSFEGAFAMMNREFLIHEWSDFKFVNREEDMGLEGLRKAKESYRPIKMVKKYIATLKQ